MKYWSFLFLAGLLTACTGDKVTTGDDDDNAGDDDDNQGDDDDNQGDDDDDVVNDSGSPPDDSGTIPQDYIDPVAVAFALDGAINADGSLASYNLGGYTFEPVIVVWAADEGVFPPTSDYTLQCPLIASFTPPPGPPLFNQDQNVPFWSYPPQQLVLEDAGCAGFVDPAIHGAKAEILIGNLNAYLAPIAMSVNPPLPDHVAGWPPYLTKIPNFLESIHTQYVGLPDKKGNYVGSGDTIGFAYQWDPATGDAILDAYGYAAFADVSAAVEDVWVEGLTLSYYGI